MGDFEEKIVTDKKIWEDFLLSRNPQSFLQSWNWGETNRLMGRKIFRVGIYNKQTSVLEGIYLAIKEEAKRGPHLLIPAGPIINWDDRRVINYFVKSIKILGKQERVWFIRIRPELLDKPKNRELLSNLGFISSPMHLHAENTWVLDISPEDGVLLAGMRKTTRYLIRKGLGMKLVVESTKDPESARILAKLQKETVKRHKFVGFPEKLFRAQLETFGKDGQAENFLCRKGSRYLASAIIIFYGKYAYYHHSASTSAYPVIPFSCVLQWRIIETAKKRGCRYYNFWGIAPTDSPRHRFAGVTLFKKGFGGERVDWLHAHDLPISWKYWLTYIFETLRRIFRRL
ncbi:MAG: lipid II:glycine glycyltransferase FemX [Patescibacteria group bacterium]